MIVDDPYRDLDSYLDLELSASGPFARFVYGDIAVARRVHGAVIRAGVGEFAPAFGRLVRNEAGRPVAMYTAPFDRQALAKARLLAARALLRVDEFHSDAAIRQRMNDTRGLFATLEEGDGYLSRIAVDERARGLGRSVFELFHRECAGMGVRRIVLEVADEHLAAKRFYARLGFHELTRKSVDRGDGTSLAYTHLARDIDG